MYSIRIRTRGGIYGNIWPEPDLSPNTDIITFLTRGQTVLNKGAYGAGQGSTWCRMFPREPTVPNKAAYGVSVFFCSIFCVMVISLKFVFNQTHRHPDY